MNEYAVSLDNILHTVDQWLVKYVDPETKKHFND